jgi:hypothetical protein
MKRLRFALPESPAPDDGGGDAVLERSTWPTAVLTMSFSHSVPYPGM